MAKRQGAEEEEGLDSLLDTMFNVVGILIMVLVMVQLGLQESVKQIANSVRVDPAALEQLVEDLEEAQKEKLKVQEELKNDEPDEQDLEILIKRLESQSVSQNAILESKKGELQKALVAQKDAQEMAKKAAENKEKREKLSDELKASIAQVAKLEATLDDTPPRAQKPAKVVNLPDPRPAPEGIKEAILLCTGNEVYPIDADTIRDRARKLTEFQAERNLRKYVDDPKKGIDAEKFVEDFNRRPLMDDFFIARMYASGRNPALKFEPKKNSGCKIAEIQAPRSRFQRLVTSVDPKKYYFKFIVLPDSYEAYVEARHVTDELGFLAGWVPVDANYEYKTSIGGKVKFGPEPPPPDPNAPKPPPPKPGPKPNVLD